MLSIHVGKCLKIDIVNSNILTVVVLGDHISGDLCIFLFPNPYFPIFLQRLCTANLHFIFKSGVCGDEKTQNLEPEGPGEDPVPSLICCAVE